ncbi:MAG TPA: 4Fe-4S binding protein [Anaeromyxobacteraceae bacterium]|nr:4Fe-4S binding protein [Anaeromyxobacteraceae bacterium]
MGHLVGKDVFRKLGRKLDGLETRLPWNDSLYALLKELYSEKEADVLVRMPCGLSTLDQVVTATGLEEAAVRKVLDSLTAKGLVIDLWLCEAYHYVPSPMVVGIFEFTMMRVGSSADSKRWARLFHDYLETGGAFQAANYGGGSQVQVMRTLPHEETLSVAHLEVLDHERASELIGKADRFAIGLCSCRHEKLHIGEKACQVPLEKCSAFGKAADFLIRHELAREVSRAEMEENFAQSREMGLVLNADNVKRNAKFVCHCCKCCCLPLLDVRKHGYPNAIVTSNYIAKISDESCNGCGKCAKACPIDAISIASNGPGAEKKAIARVDASVCLGCGVCVLSCRTGACRLERRGKRVIHPETTFERIMLQCLEKGTLQNQIFPRRDLRASPPCHWWFVTAPAPLSSPASLRLQLSVPSHANAAEGGGRPSWFPAVPSGRGISSSRGESRTSRGPHQLYAYGDGKIDDGAAEAVQASPVITSTGTA